jgi:hypothetical protein
MEVLINELAADSNIRAFFCFVMKLSVICYGMSHRVDKCAMFLSPAYRGEKHA